MTLNLYGVVARCKKCSCRYEWSLNNAPFIDSEIVGTCEDCRLGNSHQCVDEFQKRIDYEEFLIKHHYHEARTDRG